MVLVCLEEKEVSKVFEVPALVRYLFVYGERARATNDQVLAMKHYIENTYLLIDKKENLFGSKIKLPLLDQEAEVISAKGKRCIAKLELLEATVSFQLS